MWRCLYKNIIVNYNKEIEERPKQAKLWQKKKLKNLQVGQLKKQIGHLFKSQVKRSSTHSIIIYIWMSVTIQVHIIVIT